MAEKKSVQVRESHLRNNPSFLGKIVATVHYGDRLSVVEEKSPWVKASINGKQGWLHDSALTTKIIELNPNAKSVSRAADSDEIALAGKGFNKQVEDKFRQTNTHANFAMVDKMETEMSISQKEIEAFLKQGNLHPQGGDA